MVGVMRSAGKNAFTLFEIMVIIAVIGILAAIATFGFDRIQADARDQQRNVATATLAEALENYYDQNGEYPSCSMLTGSADDVGELLDVNLDVLQLPKSQNDNAIICSDITNSTDDDVIAYVGDDSAQCSTGSACITYTLKYVEESSGEVKELDSRRTAVVPSAPAGPSIATTATLSGANAIGTVTATSCSNNATIQYRIDTRVNGGAWQTGAWGSALSRSVAANQGSQYEFRTLTRCALLDGTTGSPTTGAVDDVVRPIDRPIAPVVTKSASEARGSADTVVWSWNAPCPTGTTPAYSTAYYRDDSSGWRSWASKGTATSQSQPTSAQGYRYAVKTKVTCKTAYATCEESPESNVVTYIRDIAAPIAPAGFHLERKNYAYGSYTSQYGMVYWDTMPTCASGLSRTFIMQTAYKFDYSGSQVTSIMGADNIFTGGTDYNSQVSQWKTKWNSSLLSNYRYSYNDENVGSRANPATDYGGGAHLSLVNTHEWLNWIPTASNRAWLVNTGGNTNGNAYVKEYRAYVRYACTNQTTGRFTVGEPGMSNYATF